ncbi:phosphotransferase enzyme family protein [Nemania abortiva]|nr:phosphotransferase enzyme family protein [Nemania abortiva]
MPSGLNELRDCVNKVRIHKARDAFVASIDEEEVCSLASSYRDGGSRCQPFQEPIRGSFNICFFVKFDDDNQKWVVRIPLAPCLAFGAKSKLESEIATMLVISERTSIPIPRIVAYRLDDDSSPLSSFLILEYVEGRKLSYQDVFNLTDAHRDNLYRSLAPIYIQLRRLEFPSVGCLRCHEDGPMVSKMNTSIDINMQELDGFGPSAIQTSYYGSSGVLASAGAYTSMLLQLADNAFAKNPSSVANNEEEGAESLYYLNTFRQFAEQWVDPRFERGPFVLVHGDLEPFNLLVDDELKIVCVLDWEWSRIVPLQFFKPPLWFANPDTSNLAYRFMYDSYLSKFDTFLSIVRTQEKERYGNENLSNEWAEAKADSGFLVADALENWTAIDWFAFRYIDRKWYRKKHLKERVQMFMDEDPTRKIFIAKKLQEGISYNAAIETLKKTVEHDVDVEANSASQPESSILGNRFLRAMTLSVAKFADWQTVLGGGVFLILGVSYLFGHRFLRPTLTCKVGSR